MLPAKSLKSTLTNDAANATSPRPVENNSNQHDDPKGEIMIPLTENESVDIY